MKRNLTIFVLALIACTTINVALATETSTETQCHPQCSWKCDDPHCPAICDPVCEPPKCHTSCAEPKNAICDVKCEKPICEVKINKINLYYFILILILITQHYNRLNALIKAAKCSTALNASQSANNPTA